MAALMAAFIFCLSVVPVSAASADLKYVISGGDTLPKDKNKKTNDFLSNHGSNCHVQQGYGMTETTGPVCFGALGSDKLGSVGIPLPGNVIRIIEPNTGLEVKNSKPLM